jgi:hypothetical protein
MKKLLVIPALLAALVFTGCSKNSTDLQAPSKVEVLLTQLKDEPLFTEYLMHMKNATDAIGADVNNLSYTDTATVKAKNLSYDEKAKKLNFTHSGETVDEMKTANTLMITLLKEIS